MKLAKLFLLLSLGLFCFTACDKDDDNPESSGAICETFDCGTQIIDQQVADPDILKLSDGSYRMYYGAEPEHDSELRLYTASSNNGTDFTHQTTELLSFATFPDAILNSENKVNLFYQGSVSGQTGQYIMRRTSTTTNGTEFLDATATPIISQTMMTDYDSNLSGHYPAAPTIVKLRDGSNGYYMIYRESVDGAYSSSSLNQMTTAFRKATSTDGTTFTLGTIVEDGRNSTYDGFIDGCELFYDDTNTLHLRYWTSGGKNNLETVEGQYEKTSSDHGVTWSNATKILDIRGGDPTYAQIGDIWYMYFTPSNDGIYIKETSIE